MRIHYYRPMAVLVPVVVCALFAVALGAPQAPAPAGKPGGIITLPIPDNPALWPNVSNFPTSRVNAALYSVLVRYGKPDNTPVPDLAQSWSAAPDGMSWTFKLVNNAKWHDGNPLTADDVVFTVNKMWVNPKFPYVQRALVIGIKEAQKIDNFTVKFVMKAPQANLPTMLAWAGWIVPKHLLEKYDEQDLLRPTEFLKHPIGSGPFKFAEFVPGSHVKLVANPDFYRGKPLLDAVVYKVITDREQWVVQLQTGDLDFVLLQPQNWDPMKNQPNIELKEAAQVNYDFVMFNNRRPPFTDKRVRVALSMAIDRKALMDSVLGGHGILANGPIGKFIPWAYNPKAKQMPYDPQKAEALLEEAGWKKGPDGIREKGSQKFSYDFEIFRGDAKWEQAAVIVREYWKKVGVDARIVPQQFVVLSNRSRDRSGPIMFHLNYWVTPPDPDFALHWGCDSTANIFFYCNKEVDRLFDEGRRESDPKKRAAIYARVQEIIAEDAPAVFLWYPYELQGVNKRVQGWPTELGYQTAGYHLDKVTVR